MSQFPRFHETYGLGFDREEVPSEIFDRYRGELPDDLLDEWRQHGFCGHGDGFLWTVDPDQLAAALQAFLGDSSRCHAFLRTAFGGIFYWDGADARYLDVLVGDTSVVFHEMDALFDGLLRDNIYLKTVLRYDLFKKALPKLGRLKKDECYAFLPPLALGGPGTAKTVKRVKLCEHLAILAQLTSA
jgi:hypothetical protein